MNQLLIPMLRNAWRLSSSFRSHTAVRRGGVLQGVMSGAPTKNKQLKRRKIHVKK